MASGHGLPRAAWPLGLAAVLLTACQLKPTDAPRAPKASPAARPAVVPDVKASGVGLPEVVASQAAGPPLALPLRLLPPLPVSMVGAEGAALLANTSLLANDGASLIANDGSSLIANDGASLIANDGSSLIANDGASVVAGGAGNFRVAPFGLLQTTPLAWGLNVRSEVRRQANVLMSITYTVDQLLAKWGSTKPSLGRWVRFTSQSDTFLDEESAALTQVVRRGQPALRHFAALARREGGALEAAIFLVDGPEDEPKPEQQVLSVRADRPGMASVVFSGDRLFAGALPGIALETVGHFDVDLRRRSLVGQGSLRATLAGTAYTLTERRLAWALTREAQGFSFAASKLVLQDRDPVMSAIQSVSRVLPEGGTSFWQKRSRATTLEALNFSYVGPEVGLLVPLSESPPPWYMRPNGEADPSPSEALKALLPSPEAGASAPLPTWSRPSDGQPLFPFSWSPAASAGAF